MDELTMHPPSSKLQDESSKGFGSNPHEVQTLSSQDGAPFLLFLTSLK
jgi:hypothetical protein